MHDQQDLQATQQIISLFESSKAQIEDELESLPGVYGVVAADGTLLKGNKTLAELLGCTIETLIGESIQKLFPINEWHVFQTSLRHAAETTARSLEFQANLKSTDGTERTFVWNAKFLPAVRPEVPQLFSVLGQDVTELNRATMATARMQIELNTAKMVQDTLFPLSNSRFGESSISGHYESATECGGDWWYYTKVANKLYVWIGDVTGHGVPAALVTSAVRAAVSVLENRELSPAECLSVLNRAVNATSSGQKFMTFFVICIDMETGDAVYCGAAHEPCFIIPNDVQQVTASDLKLTNFRANLPLGAGPSVQYEEYKMKFKRGDRLFLYTDGIYDVQDPSGEAFGRANFRRLLAAAASTSRSPYALVEAIKRALSGHRKDAPLTDDITFVTFQF